MFSGISKTSSPIPKDCFLNSEFSHVTIAKCFFISRPLLLILEVKKLYCEIVSIVVPDLDITMKNVLFKSRISLRFFISIGSTLSKK
jgi:hypothetical protein